jgi:hypothetical protein
MRIPCTDSAGTRRGVSARSAPAKPANSGAEVTERGRTGPQEVDVRELADLKRVQVEREFKHEMEQRVAEEEIVADL